MAPIGNMGLAVDWNFPIHEGHINNRGESVIHEIGLRCPCNNEDTYIGLIEKGNAVKRHRMTFNCNRCNGEGYIYRKPMQLIAIVSSISENKAIRGAGWAYPGDAVMSVKPGYSVAAGDRITFTWPEEVHDGQVVIRGAAQINDNAARKTQLDPNEDRLWYHATDSIYCEDDEGNEYSSQSDFILDGSKVIKWGARSPRIGQSYVIKYRAYLEWIIFMPPNSRRDRGRDLGSRSMLRKRHIAVLNDNPSISTNDRVTFCSKLSDSQRCP